MCLYRTHKYRTKNGPKNSMGCESLCPQWLARGNFFLDDFFAVPEAYGGFCRGLGVERWIAGNCLPRCPWFSRSFAILNRDALRKEVWQPGDGFRYICVRLRDDSRRCVAGSGAAVGNISAAGGGKKTDSSVNATSACRAFLPGNADSRALSRMLLSLSVSSMRDSCHATSRSEAPWPRAMHSAQLLDRCGHAPGIRLVAEKLVRRNIRLGPRIAEMAGHKEFTVATNVKVYFCDPAESVAARHE